MSNSMLCKHCLEFYRAEDWFYCPNCGKEDPFTFEWDEENFLPLDWIQHKNCVLVRIKHD